MFNLDKVHIILDEMILNGHIVETNRNRILAPLQALDKMAEGWMKPATLGKHGLVIMNMCYLYIIQVPHPCWLGVTDTGLNYTS